MIAVGFKETKEEATDKEKDGVWNVHFKYGRMRGQAQQKQGPFLAAKSIEY